MSSNSTVLVQTDAASAAVSGSAWALAAGAAGSPSGVAAPAVAGAAPASAAVSATGLQVSNDLSNTQRNNAVSAGGTANSAPIVLAPNQVADVTARGVVNASSGAACAGPSCQTALSQAGGGSTQAASGTADARGLVAQNVVNTNAAAAVRIAGRNFSPIQIIIDSVTRIYNLGIGSSLTGDATAGGSQGATSAAQTASSGAVQATGAQVQNVVNLRSDATVRVTGDNYSPIVVLLNLAANLWNRGLAIATSGDTQASGGGGAGSATSGGATATGLQAVNIVNMWATALVDIEGNNYAPITIDIEFNTNIDNRGIGVATSGNVAAGRTGTQAPSSSSNGGTASNASNAATAGSSTQAGRAKGGNSTAIANSIDSTFGSSQIAGANGGKAISAATITQMLRKMPPGSWDPFADPPELSTSASPVEAGTNSSSGDTNSTGLHAVDVASNSQLAACSDPGIHTCTARNSAILTASMSDMPNNPAVRGNPSGNGPGGNGSGSQGGGPTANSGDALVNVTPTPTPSPKSRAVAGAQSGSSKRSSSGGGTRHFQYTSHTVVSDVPPWGHYVTVDLWDNWPGRRLPPMPGQSSGKPEFSNINVSPNGWPGVDELPLPELAVDTPGDGAQSPAPVGRPSTLRAATSVDVAADDDGPLPLLDIFNADPFGWPAVGSLPLPGQIIAAGVVAPQSAEDSSSDGAAAVAGGVPIEDIVAAAVLAVVGAAVGGSRRGRRALRNFASRLRELFEELSSRFARMSSRVRYYSR